MKSNRFFDNIQNTKFDFVKNFFKMLGISLAIIFVGLIVWLCAGFNLGLDFTGGTIVKIQFGPSLEQSGKYEEYSSQIQNVFQKYGISISQMQKEQNVSSNEACISVRFQDLPNLSEAEMSNLIKNEITTDLTLIFNPNGENEEFQVYEGQKIGSTASSELLVNALLAIIIASVLLLIYIAIRFQFVSGIATLLTIIHDVLIMLAFVAICRIEVNAAFIAALITVIGYSINNTIIVFDRVRENSKIESVSKLGQEHVVNVSIKQTLIRSIYTSLTTLISIVVLVIIGVPSIKIFLLPIVVGLIAGTYSSIFLASPLWTYMLKRYNNRKKIEGQFKKQNQHKAQAIDSDGQAIEVKVVEE